MLANNQHVSASVVDPEEQLKAEPLILTNKDIHPASVPLEEDSATTKAEKLERRGRSIPQEDDEPSSKRVRLNVESEIKPPLTSERQKGVAPIKAE